MITRTSTLQEIAFEVCTALAQRGLDVVLVGGSAATFYAPAAYQSYDADFVAQFSVDRRRQNEVIQVMQLLGYHVKNNLFVHLSNPFTVDFPRGPLAIGGDIVKSFDTVRSGSKILNILSPTDCVRDRLAKYYFWDDFTALRAAIDITKTHQNSVDIEIIRTWSEREGEGEKFKEFLSSVQS